MHINQQRTVGFDVTRGFINVAHQGLGSRQGSLKERQNSHVASVDHIGGHVHICKYLVEVAHLRVHLAQGQETQG